MVERKRGGDEIVHWVRRSGSFNSFKKKLVSFLPRPPTGRGENERNPLPAINWPNRTEFFMEQPEPPPPLRLTLSDLVDWWLFKGFLVPGVSPRSPSGSCCRWTKVAVDSAAALEKPICEENICIWSKIPN